MMQQADSLACSVTATSREVTALPLGFHKFQQTVLLLEFYTCLTTVLPLKNYAAEHCYL